MPKRILTILILITASFFYLFLESKETYADPTEICPMIRIETEPANFPLTNKSERAKFIVDVSGIGGSGAYKQWKAEFKCGASNYKEIAQVEDAKSISTQKGNIPNLGGDPCEFHIGPHEIWVKAVVGGQEVDQCRVMYDVQNHDRLCKLDIDPRSDITPATTLTVKGIDLTPGGRFAIFVDEKGVDLPPAVLINPFNVGTVSTPTFSKQLPQNFMTLGEHILSLRKFRGAGVTAEGSYGSPLCPFKFTVGPSDRPGSAISPPAKPISRPGLAAPLTTGHGTTGMCPAAAGGCSCEIVLGSTRYQGIATAVGCVPTQPVGLIRAFLGLLLGIVGGIAFLIMVLGVFQMLTSAGNPDTLKQGTERLTSAIIGLLFIIFSLLLLQIIGVGILNIPGFS